MGSELIVDQGTFLASAPELLDPNFMHTVVLMCGHTPEGAYGLIVNRPSEYVAADVLSGHELLKQARLRMFVGGPVSLESLQVLHRAPHRIRGGVQLADELWIGGELDDVGRFALDDPEGAAAAVKLFMGYAGWGAGQLELELATGSWLPAPGSAERVFRIETKTLWREVVRGLGPDFAGAANEPPEPEWN